MEPKRRLTVFLDQAVIDVLKLDAVLSRSTVSARVREVIEKHAKALELGQPRSMFARSGEGDFRQ